jgi:hypothetical protein
MNLKPNIWFEKPQRDAPTPPGGRGGGVPLIGTVEAVEKVPEEILGRDAEKSDIIEYGPINNFMLAKGQLTPENIVLTCEKDFSHRLVGMDKQRRSQM